MCNRKQNTKFNNKYSDDEIVPIGLPQGTALSVLLFILYINDIVKVTDHAKVVMFADDTTITVKAKTYEDAIHLMNNDFNKILNWLNLNKLMLNVDKTKCMIFSSKSINTSKYITLGGCNIERVDKIKYLGFMINEKLNLNDQIQKCTQKAAVKVNMLKRISKKLTFQTRKIIYSTLVQPNFDYCSTIYLNATKEQVKTMQKIQNRGMRTILRCEYNTPKKFMLNCLGWLGIEQRIIFNVLVMIHKIKIGLLPDYLTNEITYVRNVSTRSLRNSNDFRLPNFKNELTRNSIFYEGVKKYNALPNVIKEINSITKFKVECKKYVLEKYPII